MPLGRRTDCGDARYSGVEVDFESDLVQSLQVGLAVWYDLGYAGKGGVISALRDSEFIYMQDGAALR